MKILTAMIGLLLAGCSTPEIPDPHNHVIDVHVAPWSVSITPDARLVWVDPPRPVRIQCAVTNQSKTARAYVVEQAWEGVSVRDHIQIEYFKSQEIFEIEGIPMEHRPYSDLVWVGSRYLVFDRWSQPHYGMHYIVDIQRKKVVLAQPFPDQFFLDQQRPEK